MGASQLHAETDPQWLEGFCSYRADISWLILAGFYCACASSYITFKLLCMQSPMIFPDWPAGQGGPTMLSYYNAVIMKQESYSIFCADEVMSHHDSVLFQKAGATSLRTWSLCCIDALCLSPGTPLEFPPS